MEVEQAEQEKLAKQAEIDALVAKSGELRKKMVRGPKGGWGLIPILIFVLSGCEQGGQGSYQELEHEGSETERRQGFVSDLLHGVTDANIVFCFQSVLSENLSRPGTRLRSSQNARN